MVHEKKILETSVQLFVFIGPIILSSYRFLCFSFQPLFHAKYKYSNLKHGTFLYIEKNSTSHYSTWKFEAMLIVLYFDIPILNIFDWNPLIAENCAQISYADMQYKGLHQEIEAPEGELRSLFIFLSKPTLRGTKKGRQKLRYNQIQPLPSNSNSKVCKTKIFLSFLQSSLPI